MQPNRPIRTLPLKPRHACKPSMGITSKNRNAVKVHFLVITILAFPFILYGQNSTEPQIFRFPRHYISVNPLNLAFFQQAGATYEFKPGRMGFALSTGYIYSNHQEYSNYFVAGPTNYGSLGDYSGWFAIPQVNVYINKPKDPGNANLFYVSLKGVYRYMQIDSTQQTAWYNEGDGYYWYRKMIDKVNIYGWFVDFGYKFVLQHFFLDVNFGVGSLSITHKMTVSGESQSSSYWHYFHPPDQDELQQQHVTINFSLNLGGAF